AAGHNDDLAIADSGSTVVFTQMSTEHPNEISRSPIAMPPCIVDYTDQGARAVRYEAPACQLNKSQRITHLNDAVFAQAQTSQLEPFWFPGALGVKVQGFLVKPPNFDEHKRYPIKFLIHGGPQGAWGDSWTYRWNAQLFAADGYAVVMINPRGSTGYG